MKVIKSQKKLCAALCIFLCMSGQTQAGFFSNIVNAGKQIWNNRHVKIATIAASLTGLYALYDQSWERASLIPLSVGFLGCANSGSKYLAQKFSPNNRSTQRNLSKIFRYVFFTAGTTPLTYLKEYHVQTHLKEYVEGSLGSKSNSIYEKIAPEKIELGFAQIAGCEKAIKELKKIILLRKNPSILKDFGIEDEEGIILYGKPGVGKTILANAFAKEMKKPLFSLSGSSFIKKYVGTGADRARKLFKAIRKEKNGAIMFIDEIDSILINRDNLKNKGGDSEYRQTINQLLAEIGNTRKNKGIIIIGASNKNPEDLDKASVRSGRLGNHIKVHLPNKAAKAKIFQLNLPANLYNPINLQELANSTDGFSGADIAAAAKYAKKQAAIRFIKKGQNKRITKNDLISGIKYLQQKLSKKLPQKRNNVNQLIQQQISGRNNRMTPAEMQRAQLFGSSYNEFRQKRTRLIR